MLSSDDSDEKKPHSDGTMCTGKGSLASCIEIRNGESKEKVVLSKNVWFRIVRLVEAESETN